MGKFRRAFACLLVWLFCGVASAEDVPTTPLTQVEQEILERGEPAELVAWLEEQYQSWAGNPAARNDAHKARLTFIGKTALARKDRGIRTRAVQILAVVAPSAAANAALRELRDAVFENDEASLRVLRPVIGNMVLTGVISLGREISLADQYGRELYEIGYAFKFAGGMRDVPSDVIVAWVMSGIESRKREDYRRAQAGLMLLAEHGAPEADAFIERAAKSDLKVSIKGNSEFYPLRETAAVAVRVLAVARAENKAKVIAETMATLQPRKTSSDEVVLLWCLDYLNKQKVTSAIPFLEGLLPQEPFLAFREQITTTIQSLRAAERSKDEPR